VLKKEGGVYLSSLFLTNYFENYIYYNSNNRLEEEERRGRGGLTIELFMLTSHSQPLQENTKDSK